MSKTKSVDPYWWEKEKKHLHIPGYIRAMDNANPQRKMKALTHARLYSNTNMVGLDPHTYSRYDDSVYQRQNDDARIKLNVIGSVIDTLQSSIAKNMPKVNLLPSGADWDIQTKAKRLQKFINATFENAGVYPEALKAFVDMGVFGTGVLYPYEDDGKLCVERVIPTEIYVDEAEAVYGTPRQIHRVRTMSRHVAKALFPGFDKEIDNATASDTRTSYRSTVSDVITVFESWHLPSKEGAGDGRHTITIDTADLLDEEYTNMDFPFVFMRWKEPLLGFFGKGIAEELTGLQVEINKILMRIQKAFHLLSNPMVFLPTGTAISKAHINNKIGVIIPFSGAVMPKVITHQTVHPEVMAHLDRLYARAFEIVGVSQLRASAKKPSGLDSGKALREFDDIQSERFSVVSAQWERMFVELAKKLIGLAREGYSEGISAKVKGKKFVETIKWADVDLDDDKFVIQVSTSSSLPDTKAGRTQESLELLQAGAITTQEWRDLQNIEDLETDAQLDRASRDYIREVVDNMLDDGEMTLPEPYDNLVFARGYAMKSLQRAKLSGAPEDRLELLRQYIDMVTDMLNEQPPMPEGMPQPGPAAGPQQGTTPQQLVPGGMPVAPQGV